MWNHFAWWNPYFAPCIQLGRERSSQVCASGWGPSVSVYMPSGVSFHMVLSVAPAQACALLVPVQATTMGSAQSAGPAVTSW